MTSAIAAVHSYIADCTVPAARSRTLSLSVGLLFLGMSAGPTIGGLLIRLTGQTIVVFYLGTAIHCMYALLVWTVVPESLSPALMRANRRRKREEEERELRGEVIPAGRARKLFKFLSPLSVFAPAEVEVEGSGTGSLTKKRKDWNLTFLAVAYGFSVLIMVRSHTFLEDGITKLKSIPPTRPPTNINSNSRKQRFIGLPKK